MFAALDLSAAELAVCCAAAVGGAVVQGVLGFGYAFVVVPVLLFVAPASVPATPLAVALPMVLVLAAADRADLDVGGFGRLTLGRLPGTALGAWVLTMVGTDLLTALAGGLLLTAALASAARGAKRASHGLEVAAGFASGFAGTVASLGGPYLGLAYADRPAAVLRGTISAAFAVGVAVSLLALAVAGEVSRPALLLAAALVPATFAGLALGRVARGRLAGRRLRPAVLGFAGTAGLVALVESVL